MGTLLKQLYRALGRIFPDCITLGQAIAFNMFVAFFPILLLFLGLLSNTSIFQTALREIPDRLKLILPPGTTDVVSAYFVRRSVHTWRWVLLGLGGTLIAGSQVMVGFIEGFQMIEGDLVRPSYWRIRVRSLVLICLTIFPILTVVLLTVFGKQARISLIHYTGLPRLIRDLEFLVYASVVFLLAMAVLMLIYRLGRPSRSSFRDMLPGAALATFLWWVVDISLGVYVRKMPYNVVYGGLAAAIGLLVWMYLTATIVLLGAAYNAEAREASKPEGITVISQ